MITSPSRGRAPALAFALACVGLTACKAKDTSAPRDFAGAGIDDLERMLAANERQLANNGVTVTRPPPASADNLGGGEGVGAEEQVPPPAEPEPEAEPPDMVDERDDYATETSASPEPAPVSESRSTTRREQKKARRLKAERCTTICDLASSTCGLEQQICRLANEHQDETRYRDSCERAELDCEVSAEACRECE